MFHLNRYRAGLAAGVIAAATVVGACRGADDERARSQAAQAGDQAQAAVENSWVTTKIQAQFFADQDVKGRNIDVTTEGGVVTLAGRVESEQARHRALEIARQTEGVTRVEDRLTVGVGEQASAETSPPAAGTSGQPTPSEPGQPSATMPTSENVPLTPPPSAGGQGAQQLDVVTRVQAQYFNRQSIRQSDIRVTADRGVLTLSGSVPSESIRQEALTIARNTPGVQRVEDQVRVRAGQAGETGTTGSDPAAIDPVGTTNPVVAPPATAADPTQPSQPQQAEPPQQQPQTQPQQGLEPRDEIPEPGGDEWITTQIQSRFFKDPLVKNASLTVSVTGGTVTLDGQVPTQAARDRAIELARQTNGVLNVVDQLTIGR